MLLCKLIWQSFLGHFVTTEFCYGVILGTSSEQPETRSQQPAASRQQPAATKPAATKPSQHPAATELAFGAWSGAGAESVLEWVETLGLQFGLRLDLGLFLASVWA